ncbi:hypothetical protein NKR23_g5039 [Pleurostoma richardsiae]|uniref:Uncharacterized protein n=1 Tax=Pleurostoma richardsiae TaxID=41990 RepID=A0AA38RUL2_9PEZI|nr:hypothetical protein NKR23_g5039 [Pleurostoma richardsiae]
MSLVEQSLCSRDAGHTSQSRTLEQHAYIGAPSSRQDPGSHAAKDDHAPYGRTIFDPFYDMDEHHDVIAPESHPKVQAAAVPPALPEKSSLRASRLLDDLVGLKLGTGIDTAADRLAQATPHDTYLSSEEDASSSADDFSDFDYDSGSEGSLSPTGSRRSHEDTARVVSVVFYGKPSIIDLPLGRRSASIDSMEQARQSRQSSRSGTVSSAMSLMSGRPSTASTAATSEHTQYHTSYAQQQRRPQDLPQLPPRSSSVPMMLFPATRPQKQRKPLFLNIDPYANGSTYSLDAMLREGGSGEHDDADRPKTPKTPTAILKKTLGLVRKRSRPMLNSMGVSPSRDSLGQQQQAAALAALPPSKLDVSASQQEQQQHEHEVAEAPAPEAVVQPQQPVTFNDIVRFAKRNARESLVSQTPMTATPLPESPLAASPAKRGLLGGLTARRRSMKVNSRML